MKKITFILASLIILSSPVVAQDVEFFEFPPTAAVIRLVEKGSPQAQVKLGRDYQDVNDYDQAFKWYMLAAEQGYARCSAQPRFDVQSWWHGSSARLQPSLHVAQYRGCQWFISRKTLEKEGGWKYDFTSHRKSPSYGKEVHEEYTTYN